VDLDVRAGEVRGIDAQDVGDDGLTEVEADFERVHVPLPGLLGSGARADSEGRERQDDASVHTGSTVVADE
jgi:hypothetical protein